MSTKTFINLKPIFVLALISATTACALGADKGLMNDVNAMIRKIEELKSPERTDLALQLSAYIKQQNPAEISEDVVTRIARLLKDRDDSVRYWAATALGYIGPKASAAAPKLLQALNEIEKDKEKGGTGKTSADAIRLALQRIEHPAGNR